MSFSMNDLKKLRAETGARVMDAKKALEEANGDFAKAKILVEEKGMARAEKTADRETKAGFVASYVHNNGQVASLVELVCETDFVAQNEDFQGLGREIAMQVAAMKPTSVAELLDQESIRDASTTIGRQIKALSGKIGEKIEINRITRFAVGESQ
ncbi:MAG TPA: translation elongation factor Ts [Patescibacteria group bacterium]|jgi:elongation factor Ts